MKNRKAIDRQTWAKWARVHSTDSQPITKQFSTEVVNKGTNPDTGATLFEFIASTATEDREGDTIAAGGWELENYKRNPVILWGHDTSSLPIGRATSVVVRGGALRVTVEFTTPDLNPEGAQVSRLVEAGFIKAVSVGFIPLKWTERATGFDFEKAELLEVSVVSVPANAEALIAAGIRPGMSVSRATLVSLLAKAIDGKAVDIDTDTDPDTVEVDGVSLTDPGVAAHIATCITNEILSAAGIDPTDPPDKMLNFTIAADGGWLVEAVAE